MLAALAAVATLLPPRLSAQIVPAGSEFQVNTYTSYRQSYPAAAAAANGNFVVVWESNRQEGGSNYGVFGQRYTSNGTAAGTEFQVNTYTTHDQYQADVAAADNGDFVVVWTSYYQDGWSYGVFGQRYASSGTPLGTEFQVNTYTSSGQYEPAVSVAGNGDFVVVWQGSYDQDGDNFGIFGQRFASGGSAAGTEFQVNAFTTERQRFPDVAAAPNGNFMVAWTSRNQDGSGEGIFGQRFASSGSPTGTEFRVNTATIDDQEYPSVAASSGGFVVVWSSDGGDGDQAGVFGQRYASGGGALGTEFQIPKRRRNRMRRTSRSRPTATSW